MDLVQFGGSLGKGTSCLVGCLDGIQVFVCVNKRCSAVLQGVSHEGRLISRGVCNQEQEGNRDIRVR